MSVYTKFLFMDREMKTRTEKAINELFKMGRFDVKIITSDGRVVSAHRFVLMMFSEFFRNIFREDISTSVDVSVPLYVISQQAMKNIVELLYCGSVIVNVSHCADLQKALAFLLIDGVLQSPVQSTVTKPRQIKPLPSPSRQVHQLVNQSMVTQTQGRLPVQQNRNSNIINFNRTNGTAVQSARERTIAKRKPLPFNSLNGTQLQSPAFKSARVGNANEQLKFRKQQNVELSSSVAALQSRGLSIVKKSKTLATENNINIANHTELTLTNIKEIKQSQQKPTNQPPPAVVTQNENNENGNEAVVQIVLDGNLSSNSNDNGGEENGVKDEAEIQNSGSLSDDEAFTKSVESFFADIDQEPNEFLVDA